MREVDTGLAVRLVGSVCREVTGERIRKALLSFAFVLLRGRRGLRNLSDTDFDFVFERAHAVAWGSTAAWFMLAALLPGYASAITTMLGSAWGTVCVVKVAVLLAIERERRSRPGFR